MSPPTPLEPGQRKSIQARIDLHQDLVADYRTRAYQMVLAHVVLTLGVCKFVAEHPEFRCPATAGLVLVTGLLTWWLGNLWEHSDTNVRIAKEFYARLGAEHSSDAPSPSERSWKRLWLPVVLAPSILFVGSTLWMWSPRQDGSSCLGSSGALIIRTTTDPSSNLVCSEQVIPPGGWFILGTKSNLDSGVTGAVVGAVLTFGLGLLALWVMRRETYRQGAYTERAKAVQELLALAREVKQLVVDGQTSSIEVSTVHLRNLAFHNRVWVGESGVEAVRRYNTTMIEIGRRTFSTRVEAEAAVDPPFRELEDRLTIPLGFRAR